MKRQNRLGLVAVTSLAISLPLASHAQNLPVNNPTALAVATTGEELACLQQGINDGSIAELQNTEIVRQYLSARENRPELNNSAGNRIREFALRASGCDALPTIIENDGLCKQIADHRNLGADELCRQIMNFEADRMRQLVIRANSLEMALRDFSQMQIQELLDLIEVDTLPESLSNSQSILQPPRFNELSELGPNGILVGRALDRLIYLHGAYAFGTLVGTAIRGSHDLGVVLALENDARGTLDAMSTLQGRAQDLRDARNLLRQDREFAQQQFGSAVAELHYAADDPEKYMEEVRALYSDFGIEAIDMTIQQIEEEMKSLNEEAIEISVQFEQRWKDLDYACEVGDCVEFDFSPSGPSYEEFKEDLAFCRRIYEVPDPLVSAGEDLGSANVGESQNVRACSADTFLRIIREFDDRVEQLEPSQLIYESVVGQQ